VVSGARRARGRAFRAAFFFAVFFLAGLAAILFVAFFLFVEAFREADLRELRARDERFLAILMRSCEDEVAAKTDVVNDVLSYSVLANLFGLGRAHHYGRENQRRRRVRLKPDTTRA
jgi:hypothetical protein